MNERVKILTTVFVAVILTFGIVYAFSNIAKEENNTDPLDRYFEERITAITTANVGQPIEGFDEIILSSAFTGLVARDFNGVQATEGKYVLQGEQIAFSRDESKPATSAGRALTAKGFNTLLENLAVRLDVKLTDEASVDSIIEVISQAVIDAETTVEGRLNERVVLGELALTPLKVIEDSRCPTDVICIQAGTVRVSLFIESDAGDNTLEFELNKPVITTKDEVTLIRVLPQTVSTTTIKEADYLFQFSIRPRNFLE